MLRHSFFSEKSQADLSNMKEFEYKQTVKLLSQIIKNNILNIINKQQKFNVSDINNIFNVFFRAMRKSFAEIAAVLT